MSENKKIKEENNHQKVSNNHQSPPRLPYDSPKIVEEEVFSTYSMTCYSVALECTELSFKSF